ncbi:hypothetical protein [Acidisoma silvae]|nr:hypothetical protein [Acidisoma silvae]
MRILFRCDPALIGHLPRPMPARQALPDWLRTMPRHAVSDMHGEPVRTVKHCPPFVDAMSHGFVVPLPCDVTVRDGQMTWQWDLPGLAAHHHPKSPISFHHPAQVEGTPLWSADQVVVKFNSFWTIELPDGFSLFAMHPANRPDLPFRLLSGLVDADRFHDVGILFPAVWLDPDFSGVLAKGTPIAQCIPVRREALTLDYEPLTDAGAKQYDETAQKLLTETGVYRKDFRAARSAGGEDSAES